MVPKPEEKKREREKERWVQTHTVFDPASLLAGTNPTHQLAQVQNDYVQKVFTAALLGIEKDWKQLSKQDG